MLVMGRVGLAMTVAGESENVSATAMLAVPVRDSAVVAAGVDEHGEDALAVWQFSAQGMPTGARVISQQEAFTSPELARLLLSILERRAITAHTPSELVGIIERLSATAGVDVSQWWGKHVFSSLDVFGDVLDRRERYGQTVTAARQGGRNVTDLGWRHDYSVTPLPQDFAALHRLAGLATSPGAPVVSEVLTVCSVLRWLIEVWQETEHVKNRRSYVFDAHGAPEVLPPSWLTAVDYANETRLPL